MPWKTQVGMVASELGRTARLTETGGGPEVSGCLLRARELMGVLESLPTIPSETGLILSRIAEQLARGRLQDAPSKAQDLYCRLMAVYSS